MTRTQLRDLVKRRLGSRTEVTDAFADLYIDQGLLDLATKRVRLASLEAVGTPVMSAVGIGSYSRPTVDGVPVFAILHLEDTVNKRVLTRFEGGFNEYVQAKANETADTSAIPSRFVEFGASFFVFPTPQVATISWTPYVYKRPFLDAAAGASPNIETEWHYPIVFFATAVGFRDLGDEARAQEAMTAFDAWIAGRDTPQRAQARNTWPSAGAKPHPAWTRSRLGV